MKKISNIIFIEASDSLKALSHPLRLRLAIYVLVYCKVGDLLGVSSIERIAEKLGISLPNAKKQMNLLTRKFRVIEYKDEHYQICSKEVEHYCEYVRNMYEM